MALRLDGLAFLRNLRTLGKAFDASLHANEGDDQLELYDHARRVFGDTSLTDAIMRAAIGGDESLVDDCRTMIDAARKSVREVGMAGWLIAAMDDADESFDEGTPSPFMFDSAFDADVTIEDLDDDDAHALETEMLGYAQETRRLAACLVLRYGTDPASDATVAADLISSDDAYGRYALAGVIAASSDDSEDFYRMVAVSTQEYRNHARALREHTAQARIERESDPLWRSIDSGRVTLNAHGAAKPLPEGFDGIPVAEDKSETFADVDRLFSYEALKAARALEREIDRDEPTGNGVWDDHDFVIDMIESLFGPLIANDVHDAVHARDRKAFDECLGDMQFAVDLVRQVGFPLLPAMLMSATSAAIDEESADSDELADHIRYCRELGASLAVTVLRRIPDKTLAGKLAVALLDTDLHAYVDVLSPWYGDGES